MKKNAGPKNILFVEDDEEVRNAVMEYLEQLGFNVITTVRGKRGERTYEKLSFSLVLVDASLSDVSGLEICKWLKSEKYLAYAPVLIISERTGIQYQMKDVPPGTERYLRKPFTLEDLSEAINSLLQSNETRQTCRVST